MNARKLHRKFYTVTRLSGRVGQVAVTVRIPREGFDTPSPEWTPPAKWNGIDHDEMWFCIEDAVETGFHLRMPNFDFDSTH